MRAMVTGATGFLGGHLVQSLAEKGFEVKALVRPTSKVSSQLRAQAQLVEGDLRSAESLKAAWEDADIVFHCGALRTNRASWKALYETNVLGTQRVLELAAEGGAQRVVHISTVLVYGLEPPRGGVAFTERSSYAQNPDRWGYYVRSKTAADELALSFCQEQGLPVTVTRLGFLYGPGGALVGQQQLGRIGPVRLLVGNGRNVRPFTYVENAVDCILLAAGSDAAVGQAYNVVDEPPVSGRDGLLERARLTGDSPVLLPVPASLLYAAAALVELPSNLSGADTPPPLTRHLVQTACRNIRYDSSKARQQLGWQQRFSLEEGLRRAMGLEVS